MLNTLSLLNRNRPGYGTLPEQDLEASAVPSSSGQQPIHSSKHNELELGNYEKNKKIFNEIWHESGSKNNWLIELGKREGIDFSVNLASSAVVTAAIYYASTAILTRLTNIQSLSSQSQDESWLQDHLIDTFSRPENRQKMAEYIATVASTAATASGNVGNSLVITQAITSALSQMGKPIGSLLKALIQPQQGTAHQEQLKQQAFRRMSKKIQPLRDQLTGHRKHLFDNTYEELRAQIDYIGKSTGSRPDYVGIKTLFDRLYIHLSYPTELEDTYQLGINGDPQKAHRIQEQQDLLTKSFMNKDTEEKLDALLTVARYATVNHDIGPVVALFSGPPSTGKTWVVNKAGKDVLKSRVLTMSIDEFLEYTGVKAKKFEFGRHQDPDLDVIKEPHKSRITDSTTLNEIILIDEVNFSETSGTKNDLDKMEKLKEALTIDPAEYPAAERIGIREGRKPIVIFCTNYGFDFIKNKAFGSRFTSYIEFHNWSKGAYVHRINNKCDGLLENMKNIHKTEVVAAMREILFSLNPFIIEQLEKHDCFHDDARITLREVHTILNKQSSKIITSLDLACHENRDLTEISEGIKQEVKSNIASYFQDVIDQYEKQSEKTEENNKSGSDGKAETDVSDNMQKDLLKKIADIEKNTDGRIDDLTSKYDAILAAAFASLKTEKQGKSSDLEIASAESSELRQRKIS